MDSPLRVHILFIENKIQELNESLTNHQHSPVDRGQIEAQIQMLVTGLDHYREALKIEEAFRHDDPALGQNPATATQVSSPTVRARRADRGASNGQHGGIATAKATRRTPQSQ